MARISVLDMLYTKDMNSLDFSFDALSARPLLTYLTPQDIQQLNAIALSIKYTSKPKLKYQLINDILVPRGFKKMASGTNRVVYKHLDDTRVIIKVALDRVGLKDSPREYFNQFLLAPFVTKCFEVSPCGTVGLFERVNPVQTLEEYSYIASDVFDVINTKIIGKYVMDDIGTRFFQNVGVREGFGVVFLDFPYVYELDGNKIFCQKKISDHHICGGEIDYDAGFNHLVCTKCGARYIAQELQKLEQNKDIIIQKRGGKSMIIEICKGNEVIKVIKTANSSDVLPQKPEKGKNERRKTSVSICTECEEKQGDYIPVTETQVKPRKPKIEVNIYSGTNQNNKSSDYSNGLQGKMYSKPEEVKAEIVTDDDFPLSVPNNTTTCTETIVDSCATEIQEPKHECTCGGNCDGNCNCKGNVEPVEEIDKLIVHDREEEVKTESVSIDNCESYSTYSEY